MRISTRFPLLRNYVSRIRYNAIHVLVLYGLSLAGLVIAIIGVFQSALLTWIGLAVAVVTLAAAVKSIHNSINDLEVQSLPSLRNLRDLKIPYRLRSAGYEILTSKSEHAGTFFTSPNVNRALFLSKSAPLNIQKRCFHPPLYSAAIEHVLLREVTRRGSIIFNGRKVRLTSDLSLTDDCQLTPVYFQRTGYFDTLKSNDSINVKLISHRTQHVMFNGQDICFPKREIPPCRYSDCANQVGASTLAVTSDNYLVLVQQGRRSARSPNLLAPSGSGTADWSDVGGERDLQQFVRRFAQRELVEECGLTNEHVAWLRIMGYGRLLTRGGKPEFFCLAKLNCGYEDVRRRRSERYFVDHYEKMDIKDERSEYSFVNEAVKLRRDEAHRLSGPLWWNIELLLQLQDEDLRAAFG